MGGKPNVAILVGTKGRGTNMANLITACLSGSVAARPALVVAPRSDAPALIRAQSLGVPTMVVPKGESFGTELASALRAHNVDIICLAGLMFLLPATIVQEYENRILNIHPALLPKFGGKGMYGIHVHRAVIAAGETESGCSIHFVNEVYDDGEVIHQRRCPVLPEDTPESLADKVLDLEHIAYPEALQMVVERIET